MAQGNAQNTAAKTTEAAGTPDDATKRTKAPARSPEEIAWENVTSIQGRRDRLASKIEEARETLRTGEDDLSKMEARLDYAKQNPDYVRAVDEGMVTTFEANAEAAKAEKKAAREAKTS